jgi:N-acetylneuraminic acid mutarotase
MAIANLHYFKFSKDELIFEQTFEIVIRKFWVAIILLGRLEMKTLHSFNLKSQKQPLAWLFYLLLLFGCSDEPEFSAPLIQTGFVSNVSEQGAQVNGIVTYKGKGNSIIGFVWDTGNNPVIKTSSKVFIDQFSEGPISFDITFDLLENQTYYVRAFGQSGNEIVYGDEVSFESLGSLGPSIENFTPTTGKRGTTFQVNGNNFTGQPLNIVAMLNGAQVEVLEANPNQLTVRIPDNFHISGKVKLSVKVAGREAISNDFFTIEGPIIDDFTAKSGIGGDSVKITGKNFGPSISSNVVKFGNELAKVLKATPLELIVLVPYQLTGGSHLVNVTVENITTQSQSNFTALQPWSLVTATSNFPFGRERAITFNANGVNYYGLGSVNNDYFGLRNDFWKYNAENNTWSKLADYPFEASSACFGFTIGLKGYVGLGWNEVNSVFTEPKKVWEYDINSNLWFQKSDFPGDGRFYPASFVINGEAFVGLGTGLYSFKDFWKYNHVNDSWQRLTDFPGSGGAVVGSAIVINSKAYLCIGKQLWEYTPENDLWIRKSDLPGNLYNATAVTSSKRVYFTGGYYFEFGSLNLSKEFWEYFPKTDSWIRRNNLPVQNGLFDSKGFSYNEKIFIVGGLNANDFQYRSYLNDLLIFNPKP